MWSGMGANGGTRTRNLRFTRSMFSVHNSSWVSGASGNRTGFMLLSLPQFRQGHRHWRNCRRSDVAVDKPRKAIAISLPSGTTSSVRSVRTPQSAYLLSEYNLVVRHRLSSRIRAHSRPSVANGRQIMRMTRGPAPGAWQAAP